ncbi:MAG: hypothetical protein AVDCRST_MAG01-01-3486, partial [uncultured Rubrobacteraceae bacterium]
DGPGLGRAGRRGLVRVSPARVARNDYRQGAGQRGHRVGRRARHRGGGPRSSAVADQPRHSRARGLAPRRDGRQGEREGASRGPGGAGRHHAGHRRYKHLPDRRRGGEHARGTHGQGVPAVTGRGGHQDLRPRGAGHARDAATVLALGQRPRRKGAEAAFRRPERAGARGPEPPGLGPDQLRDRRRPLRRRRHRKVPREQHLQQARGKEPHRSRRAGARARTPAL